MVAVVEVDSHHTCGPLRPDHEKTSRPWRPHCGSSCSRPRGSSNRGSGTFRHLAGSRLRLLCVSSACAVDVVDVNPELTCSNCLETTFFFIFFELLGQASADSRSRGCQQRPTGRIEHSCLCAAWLSSSQLWPTRPSSRQTTAASTSSKPSLQTCMRSTHTHMPCRAPDSVVEHFHTSGDEAVLWSHAAEL